MFVKGKLLQVVVWWFVAVCEREECLQVVIWCFVVVCEGEELLQVVIWCFAAGSACARLLLPQQPWHVPCDDPSQPQRGRPTVPAIQLHCQRLRVRPVRIQLCQRLGSRQY